MSEYTIIGDDGSEYGPASAEELRHWIADGRVDAQTLIRASDSGEWKPAAEFPELAGEAQP